MALLTKKFTRESLKRANVGGSEVRNESDDFAKAEMIRKEITRARTKSMQNRNELDKQHRSFSRGSTNRSLGLEGARAKVDSTETKTKNFSHPDDEFNEAYNEAELFTQMSNLTEPTWAPSIVGGSDVNSTHGRFSHQNQRVRTSKYNNSKLNLNRATITISTAKDQKEKKVLLLDDRENLSGLDNINKSSSNRQEDMIEMSRHSDNLQRSIAKCEMREETPNDDLVPSTPKTKQSSSSRWSKASRERDESNILRERGRTSRPRSNCGERKRSSSVSSKGSMRLANAASKYSLASSASIASRQSQKDIQVVARRRTTGSKDSLRSSSVPRFNSMSDRDEQISSVSSIDRTNTASTMADLTIASSQSKSHAPVSRTSSLLSADDCPPTPSSAVEAARLSLRPRLRRSNSNRSISSVQSESIISIASNRQKNFFEKDLENTQTLPSCTTISSSKTTYASRTNKLSQDIRAKRIHEHRKQRRQEVEMEHKQQEQKNDKRKQKEVKKAASVNNVNCETLHHTTVTTLMFDFLLFLSFSLLALPHRALFYILSRVFSRTWTARQKNVLVTDANSAIGSEIARQFAREGANLILVSHSASGSVNGLTWLVEQCHALGSGKVQSYSADLSNATSVELAFQQAAKDFDGNFDVVILNGFINRDRSCPFEEILDVNQIEKSVTKNTLSFMICFHHSLKYIPKVSDSRIVVLSSSSGMIASPYESVYGATQHALKGFCDSIRLEISPKICFSVLPEFASRNSHNQGSDEKWQWSKMPLQQAVQNLHGAIIAGKRDFGLPSYVNLWRLINVVVPEFVDFSVFRYFKRQQRCHSDEA